MVEIKITDDIALDQLSTYVSRIFMECIDRLFVIAFTLSEHSFRMHLFDRSGVMSSVPFNIHKVSILNIHNERRVIRHCQKPWLFVAAIAGCSAVEPEYLGWDLSIQVWDKICPVPSYKADMKQFSSAHAVPWVITAFDERKRVLPSVAIAGSTCESQSGNATSATDQEQRYVMVHCLTFQDTKRLWGRATIAMEVVSLEDWENKNEDVRPLWWLK